MGIGLLGCLGSVYFFCSSYKVITFSDLQIQRSARFANHDVLMQQPKKEYLGPQDSSINFKIQLRQAFKTSPDTYLARLKEMLESGKEQTLILGDNYEGEYILESYTEDSKKFTGFGICIAADVSLQLKEVIPGAGGLLQNLKQGITDKVSSELSSVSPALKEGFEVTTKVFSPW